MNEASEANEREGKRGYRIARGKKDEERGWIYYYERLRVESKREMPMTS